MPAKKERINACEYYKHTGNSKYGRRGIHKRLRKNAQNELDKQARDGYNSDTNKPKE